MNIFLVISEGLREIWSHKFRSFLTMLGVILGVSALMATFALTAGMAAGFQETMAMMGGLERVNIESQRAPEEQEDIAEISPGMTYADAKALRRHGTLITNVSPEVEVRGTLINHADNWDWTRVQGVEPVFMFTDEYQIAEGRFISHMDLKRYHKVTVIGSEIRQEMFPEDESPIGKVLNINGQSFTVIGVFERYETEQERKRRERAEKKAKESGTNARIRRGRGGWGPSRWKNQIVVVPLTSYQMAFRMGGGETPQDRGDDPDPPDMKLDELNFQVKDLDRFEEAISEARRILLQTHRGVEDFRFDTREEWFDRQQTATQAARISGGLIAGISLLVGGLGITNIMLASISERIRDIGIRRAVGARRSHIFTQILTESVLLAVLGGVIGLFTAEGLVELLKILSPSGNTPIIETSAMVIALGFAILTGVIAGIYPALKAANLSPLQALRYE